MTTPYVWHAFEADIWEYKIWPMPLLCRRRAVRTIVWSSTVLHSCAVMKRPISPKSPEKTHHSSPVRAIYGVSFVDSISDLYSAPLLMLLQRCMQYRVILDRVITTLNCKLNLTVKKEILSTATPVSEECPAMFTTPLPVDSTSYHSQACAPPSYYLSQGIITALGYNVANRVIVW